MTYFDNVAGWEPEKRQAFLDWLKDEDLDPNDIVDNGRFAVHNGRISGWKFINNAEGRIVNRRTVSFLKVPFNVKQKNPLPEGF